MLRGYNTTTPQLLIIFQRAVTQQRDPAGKKKRMSSSTITQGTFAQAAAVAKPVMLAIITKDFPKTNLGVEELDDLEEAIVS